MFRLFSVLLLSVSILAQIETKHHEQQAEGIVRLGGWRTFCSVNDPEPFCVTWSNHRWPTIGEHETAVVCADIIRTVPIGPQLEPTPQVFPGLIFSPRVAPWPGTGNICYTPGNGVWYFRVRPPAFLIGWKFYIQLYTSTNGPSDV